MAPRFARQYLTDGSFLEISIHEIKPDKWRTHGIRYRLAWIQEDKCRVLFDNHHGKTDHFHLDDKEFTYEFTTVEQLREDFESSIRMIGGTL